MTNITVHKQSGMLDQLPSDASGEGEGEVEVEDKKIIKIDMELMAEELNLKDTISKYSRLGLADPLNRADTIDDAIKLIKK